MQTQLAKSEPDLEALANDRRRRSAAGPCARAAGAQRVAEALRDVHAGAEGGRARPAAEAGRADAEAFRQKMRERMQQRIGRGQRLTFGRDSPPLAAQNGPGLAPGLFCARFRHGVDGSVRTERTAQRYRWSQGNLAI